MKKMFIALALTVALTFVGCITTSSDTSIGPKAAGDAAGRATALAYARIAEKQDQQFKDDVAALWKKVNEIETTDDLVKSVDDLSLAFDKVIANQNLKPEEKVLLMSMKDLVMEKVQDITAEKVTPDSDAAVFLYWFRYGVNQTLAVLYPEEQVKPADNK